MTPGPIAINSATFVGIQVEGIFLAAILEMHNCQNYSLKNCRGEVILQVMHRGICGGWNLVTNYDFVPEVICGLFLFCRYIEQENELLII